jgi:transcriptional regulator of arginine metabolism
MGVALNPAVVRHVTIASFCTTPMRGDVVPRARREVIRKLLRSHLIGTQEELRGKLKREGFDVTQATLSRDLGRLRARRVQLPEGGTAYELDEARVVAPADSLRALGPMVSSIEEGDAMVVLRTAPGAASVVAAALDASRPEGALGTLAGDDTVFICPARGVRPQRLARDLKNLWQREAH